MRNRHNKWARQTKFASWEYLELGIFLEPILKSRVTDKVLRALPSVYEMLAVVVVRVLRLSALRERERVRGRG